jgi:hypothetical protein
MKKLQNDHSSKDTQRDYCSRQGQSAGCINIIEFLVMFTTDHSDAWSLASWEHSVNSHVQPWRKSAICTDSGFLVTLHPIGAIASFVDRQLPSCTMRGQLWCLSLPNQKLKVRHILYNSFSKPGVEFDTKLTMLKWRLQWTTQPDDD